jgi:hypothetical protein
MVAVHTDRNPNVTLLEFLARRARGAADAHLMVDAVVGFVVAIAALLAQSTAWHLFASAGICFLSFGCWGLADRELAQRGHAGRAASWLAAGRVATAIAGFTAFAILVVGALGIAIGRVIS